MSTLTDAFRINGVIDTSRNVLDNLNDLCTACAGWLSYDVSTGLWSVIINAPGSSVASFNDNNIIGSINVSGRGIDELYNAVSISFPHKDLRDDVDYVDLSIAEQERYAQELDNRLNISTDLINDPVQARYIAAVELKQSRVNRIVEFSTDYTNLGLRAGELIGITSSMYSWTNKLFRIISIEEADTDEGSLILNISALEYSAAVYDSSDLIYEPRNKATGIVPKNLNTALTNIDRIATSFDVTQSLENLLAALGLTGLLDSFFRAIFNSNQSGIGVLYPGLTIPGYSNSVSTISVSETETTYNAYAGNAGGGTGFNGDLTAFILHTFVIPQDVTNAIFFLESPLADYTVYPKINGAYQARPDFVAYIPSQYDLTYTSPDLSQIDEPVYTATSDWQTQNAIMSLTNAPAGVYRIYMKPLLTYDLNNDGQLQVFHSNYTVLSNSAGGGTTCTLLVFKGFQ